MKERRNSFPSLFMLQHHTRQRRSNRIKRRITAFIEVQGMKKSCIAMHFSKVGFFLQTRNVFQKGTHLKVFLSIKPDHDTPLQGIVASIRSENPMKDEKGGIGIELTVNSEEYIQFLIDAGIEH